MKAKVARVNSFNGGTKCGAKGSLIAPSQPLRRVLKLVYESREVFVDEAAQKTGMNATAIYDQVKRGLLLTFGNTPKVRVTGRPARPLRLKAAALKFVQGSDGEE